MTYQASFLSVLAYANGFTFWHYKTQDLDITSSEYFKKADNLIRKGDMMLVNADKKSAMYIVIEDNKNNILLKNMVSVNT